MQLGWIGLLLAACEGLFVVYIDAADDSGNPGRVLGSGGDDADGDGHLTPADCDDSDPTAHPDAPERLFDDRDSDCDGDPDRASARRLDLDGTGPHSPQLVAAPAELTVESHALSLRFDDLDGAGPLALTTWLDPASPAADLPEALLWSQSAISQHGLESFVEGSELVAISGWQAKLDGPRTTQLLTVPWGEDSTQAQLLDLPFDDPKPYADFSAAPRGDRTWIVGCSEQGLDVTLRDGEGAEAVLVGDDFPTIRGSVCFLDADETQATVYVCDADCQAWTVVEGPDLVPAREAIHTGVQATDARVVGDWLVYTDTNGAVTALEAGVPLTPSALLDGLWITRAQPVRVADQLVWALVTSGGLFALLPTSEGETLVQLSDDALVAQDVVVAAGSAWLTIAATGTLDGEDAVVWFSYGF